jgi:hypothetical protein
MIEERDRSMGVPPGELHALALEKHARRFSR